MISTTTPRFNVFIVLVELAVNEVRKTPSWPRSWANFSLLHLYSHRNAWANLHLLHQPKLPNVFSLQVPVVAAHYCAVVGFAR
jgi:hypothetical protein